MTCRRFAGRFVSHARLSRRRKDEMGPYDFTRWCFSLQGANNSLSFTVRYRVAFETFTRTAFDSRLLNCSDLT
jgi:hypothetical protein